MDALNEMKAQAIAELERRGDMSAADADMVAREKASLQQQAVERAAEWEANTRKRFRENTRHPVKLVKREGDNAFFIDGSGPTVACELLETTGFTDQTGAGRLLKQVTNAQSNKENVEWANSALSFLNGIAPENPLEGLLAAQMTACHNMAMEFSRRAMREGQSSEGIDRNINRTAKMMNAFTRQIEALQKLRNKGQQKITVQHVQVSQGGQAIIGDVIPQGRK